MNDLEAEIVSLENVMRVDSDFYGLRAGVDLAICKFLMGDLEDSKRHLLSVAKIRQKASPEFKNEKVYWKYLLRILLWHEENNLETYSRRNDKNLYVIGERHSSVSHRLNITVSDSILQCMAKLIKGCKQWHLGNSGQNRYKNQFERIFFSLPKSSDVLLAIGEIDCRLDGGNIKHANESPQKKVKNIIVTTVENFLTYIQKNNSDCRHKVIIQGVPSPNIDITNNTQSDIRHLVEVINLFNYELKTRSKEKGFRFLDTQNLTDNGDGLSNGLWHIDNYHLSPQGMQETWRIYASERI